VAIKRTNKYSIITIINWDTYQGEPTRNVQVNDQDVSRSCPGSVQVVSTNKNDKNEKNVKNKSTSSPYSPPSPEKNSGNGHGQSPDGLMDEILESYHAILGELPKASLTKKRKSWLNARIQEFKERRDIEWWRWYWNFVTECPHLMGDNDREWKADFEWLIKAENMIKVLEGRYHKPISARQFSRKTEKNIQTAMEWLKESGGTDE